MIAMAAVDVRRGACVQLVGGDVNAERVRLADPTAVARRWSGAGFRWLHIVDLDAALGDGENVAAIAGIVGAGGASCQVGGGIRSDEAASRALASGAARIVVGTRALSDPEWLATLACAHPARVVVAVDARDGQVLSHGWVRSTSVRVLDAIAALGALPLAAILLTAVEREGRLAGTDLPLMARAASAAAVPLIASGGISTIDELRALRDAGVGAAVLGMALYTGTLDPERVAAEFGE